MQSIPATDELKRWLLKKGFHETLGPYCIYYYHHPMYGLLFLYPGVFTGTVNTDGRALLEYLRSSSRFQLYRFCVQSGRSRFSCPVQRMRRGRAGLSG